MKAFSYLIIILLSCRGLSAQKELLQKAERHYELAQYDQVLKTLEKAELLSDDELKLKKAISLFETNQIEKSVLLLKSLSEDNQDAALFYLALIKQQSGDYEDAISQFKNFIKRTRSDDPLRQEAVRQIKHCAYAIKNWHQDELAFVENIGQKINTPQDDYAAIQSPNFQDRFYFSSNREGVIGGKRDQSGEINFTYGNYKSDMFYVETDNGIWSDVYVLDPDLNTAQHEVIFDFAPDGSRMIFSRSEDRISSVIMENNFGQQDSLASVPLRFNSKIIGELEDRDVQMYSDSIFVFSSRRVGGEGGYDIYITEKTEGRWLEPKNLGSAVNTIVNEVSPFLTADGLKLYFSADALEGYGGYDVYVSDYDEKSQAWSSPNNLGKPINSMKDDLYYRVSSQANSATFSSDRYDGEGGLDLYIAYLKKPEESHTVYANHVPFLDDVKRSEISDDVASSDGVTEPSENIVSLEDSNVKISYPIRPLLMDESDKVIHAANMRAIQTMLKLMQDNPDMIMEVQGHTAQEGSTSIELYYALKRTEPLVKYMINQGISADRIKSRGYGNTLMVANEMLAKTQDFARTKNNRVNVIFHQYDSESIAFDYDYSISNRPIASDQYQNHLTSVQGLSYRIEIAKVNQLLQSDLINDSSDCLIEDVNDAYAYSIGLFKTYAEAVAEKKDLYSLESVEDMKIIAFMNGLRIGQSELDGLLGFYPDLEEYVEGWSRE